MTIRGLIVDDNRSVREAFILALRIGPQMDLRGAANPQEALEQLVAHHPSFVLVDMSLDGDPTSRGGMSVVYAAKEITPHVCVVTGMELECELQIELASLDVTCFQKPLDARPVLSYIAKRVLRGAPLAKPTPNAIRHAADALRKTGKPFDQNAELVVREAVGLTLDECGGKKARAATLLATDRRWIDRHLPENWEERFERRAKKKSGQ